MMQITFSPQGIGSFGLVLDIVGAVLLFRYGLPADVSRSGVISWPLSKMDETEKAEGHALRPHGRSGSPGGSSRSKSGRIPD